MSVTVLHPGLLTTVQDMGRVGYQAFGVPVSGAVDRRSAAIANILAGNPRDEAVLECTLLGPRLRFDSDACVAVTGGDLGAMLDGQPMPAYAAVPVKAGQVLHFSGVRTGCRAYLAFAGGLEIPVVMGSRSTYRRAGLGGFHGRELKAGDVLDLRAPGTAPRNLGARTIAPEFVPRAEYTLHVILGPQDDAFLPEGLEAFLGQTYTVTPEFDRMGCRLDGPVIRHRVSGDIISDGIVMGAVQVPASGKPIVMLSDCQTTGGYTKIAGVMSVDFRILAQLKAGDRVRFQKVSMEFAQDALLTERAALRALQSSFS